MLDEIEQTPAVSALVATVMMVYIMFFMNPEYWSVIPMSMRVLVALASPFVAYFVTVKMANK